MAVHFAYESNPSIVKLLIKHGVKINTKGRMDLTPLDIARYYHRRCIDSNLINLLIKHGANNDKKTWN